MISELDPVVLTENLPEPSLEKGDLGTVVPVDAGGKGYEVEFVTLGGDTVAVVALSSSQVRPVGAREFAHVRAVA
ncbi:MAG: DUF4926 domain-containing protein [Chromatiales bacterium]